jgi:hypothetical protein
VGVGDGVYCAGTLAWHGCGNRSVALPPFVPWCTGSHQTMSECAWPTWEILEPFSVDRAELWRSVKTTSPTVLTKPSGFEGRVGR